MSNFDLDEFMEKATATMDALDEGPIAINPSPARQRKKEKEEEKLGQLTQYASISGCFVPTSNTIKTLPPDCYTLSQTMEGSIIFRPQKLTTDNLMRLPDSKSDEVIAEVNKFWELKDKFKKFGFAHKRGFLLWGPPGSGKTSTISITINDMVKAGGIVILGDHPGTLAKALAEFRTIELQRPLTVILEDIDTIIQNYGESHVLSILDGEAQVENVVFIATTNYPEKLDGRVINRPSRFDKVVKINLPNSAARKMFLESKIDSTVVEGIDLVTATEGFSIAHIKELIISTFCQGNPVAQSLDRLKKMKQKPSSESESFKVGI